MIKVIFRETIIILLLCVAILLILGVLFYDYNPIGKVVPNKIAYTVPEDIKDDLEEENIIEEELVMQNIIYKVEGSDLNIYKKSNSYNPGKANPFAETVSDSTSVVNNTATVQKETTINSTQNVLLQIRSVKLSYTVKTQSVKVISDLPFLI